MACIIKIVLLLMVIQNSSLDTIQENSPESCYPDYYWRDFTGTIPYDAIIGGIGATGKPFYVAQAFFRHNELLPATVYAGAKVARASAYNKVLEASQNVKILCSPFKDHFEWIRTESKDLHLITNTHIVIGGSEVGEILYIGRVFHGKETVLGKIFRDNLPNKGIYIPLVNGKEGHYLSYELLTYNWTMLCNNGLSNSLVFPR